MLERAQAIAGSRCEAGEREQRIAPLVVFVDALLEDTAERLPDLGECLRVLVGEILQLADDTAGERLPDLRHLRVVLQHLARNIERQVLAVHNAAHEAQIGGQQLRLVGDEDAPHIKLDMAFAAAIEQVEGLGGRRKQQHRIGLAALGPIVERHGGLVERAGDRPIGLRIIFCFEFRFGALP